MITFGWLFGRYIFQIVTANLWKSDRPAFDYFGMTYGILPEKDQDMMVLTDFYNR